MIEHRLIERMIDVMREELNLSKKRRNWIWVPGDGCRLHSHLCRRCHHGKEEDILFRELGEKKLKDDHTPHHGRIDEDHRGEERDRQISRGDKRYIGRGRNAMPIADRLHEIPYSIHLSISKKRTAFFIPCMSTLARQSNSPSWERSGSWQEPNSWEVQNMIVAAEKELTFALS